MVLLLLTSERPFTILRLIRLCSLIKRRKHCPVNWDNSEGRITGQMRNAPYIDIGVLLHHLLYREHFSFL